MDSSRYVPFISQIDVEQDIGSSKSPLSRLVFLIHSEVERKRWNTVRMGSLIEIILYIYAFVLRAGWRYVGAFGISMVQRCSNKL